MVVEIGERRMDLSECYVRVLASNLLRRESVPLMIGDDILDANPRAADERPRLPVAVGAEFNVAGAYRLRAHTLSLSHPGPADHEGFPSRFPLGRESNPMGWKASGLAGEERPQRCTLWDHSEGELPRN